jgi:hypothetical protein
MERPDPALFCGGEVFGLKRRRRHDGLTNHAIGPAHAGPANAGAGGCRPGQQRWCACSEPPTIRTSVRADLLVSELPAVPLPSSGHTQLAGRLAVGDRFLARFRPEHGKFHGYIYLEYEGVI